MNLGLMIPILPWNETVEWAKSAVDRGAASIWAADERDPLTLLSGLSQAGIDADVGLLHSRLADRPPLLAAKQLTVLEHLTKGRVHVGVATDAAAGEIADALAGPYLPQPLQEDGIKFWQVFVPRKIPAEPSESLGQAVLLDNASQRDVRKWLDGDADLAIVGDMSSS